MVTITILMAATGVGLVRAGQLMRGTSLMRRTITTYLLVMLLVLAAVGTVRQENITVDYGTVVEGS